MTFLCPRHSVPLRIEEIDLELQQERYHSVLGKCPKCRSVYINCSISPSCKSFQLNGIRYEYLQELNSAFPFDPYAEKRKHAQNIFVFEQKPKCNGDLPAGERENLARLDRIERKKEELWQKQLQAKADFLVQKKAKNKALQKELQAKKQAKKSSKISKQDAVKKFYKDPKQAFYSSEAVYYETQPEACPNDGESLIVIKKVLVGGNRECTGLCCMRCRRVFLPKGTVLVEKQDSSRKTDNATKKANELSRKSAAKEDKGEVLQQKVVGTAAKADTSVATSKTKKALPPNCIKLPNKISNVPRSTILTASLEIPAIDEVGSIAIVADEHDQCAERGIYWIGRTLPSMILAAIKTDKKGDLNIRIFGIG